jgi:hypothetical protein
MSLTKVSYSMIQGAVANVLDYGAVGDGVANDTAAIQAALDASSAVYLPAGNYKITSALELNVGQHVFGDSYLASQITVTGAINGLTAIFASLTETGILIENLRIIGQTASSLNLLSFEKATAVTIRECNIRNTSQSCIRMNDNCINFLIERVRFENFTLHGIEATNFSSANVVIAPQFDANGVNGVSCFNITTCESWTVIGANVNGGNLIGFVRGGLGNSSFIDCYVELLDAPAFVSTGGSLFEQLQVIGGNYNSNDSIVVADFSVGGTHKNVSFRNLRFTGLGGSFGFNPGANTANFDWVNNDTDTSTQVVGYTTTGDVVKQPLADPKIKRYFNNTAALAAGGSAQVTINIGSDFPTTNYDISFAIQVVGGGENSQNKNEMSYKIDDVTLSSIVFTCTRTGGTSTQTCYYYVTVFGYAT